VRFHGRERSASIREPKPIPADDRAAPAGDCEAANLGRPVRVRDPAPGVQQHCDAPWDRGGSSRFRWGHVRQLDRVSRLLLERAWAAGAGPGAEPFTIDLDSTICETYGLAKEGATHHGYTGVRGYHPLLAVAAGTGDVLMARLREGRANTVRGAAHFLVETIGRVRQAGASGELTRCGPTRASMPRRSSRSAGRWGSASRSRSASTARCAA